MRKIEMTLADECLIDYLSEEQALADRKLFVSNLGVFLTQTGDDVLSIELDDNDIATIRFIGGGTKRVNVHMDSYLSIVKDIVLRI